MRPFLMIVLMAWFGIGAAATFQLRTEHAGVVFAGKDAIRGNSKDQKIGIGKPIPRILVSRAAIEEAVEESYSDQKVSEKRTNQIVDDIMNPRISSSWFVACAIDDFTKKETLCSFPTVRFRKDKAGNYGRDVIEVLCTGLSHNAGIKVKIVIQDRASYPEIGGNLVSEAVNWTSRTEGTASIQIDQEVTTLNDSKHKGFTRGTFTLTHLGGANPLQDSSIDNKRTNHLLFDDQTYHDITLDATISAIALDQQSRIKLKWQGTSSRWSGGSLVCLTGFAFESSQSAAINAAYADTMFRLGDRRTRGDNFYQVGEETAPLYFDFGSQIGGAYSIQTQDQVLGSVRGMQALIRPNFRVGIHKANVLGGELNASIRYYYLLGSYSGSKLSDLWREEFAVNLKLGGVLSNFTLSVSGGTNPASGFERIAPTYSLKGSYKF